MITNSGILMNILVILLLIVSMIFNTMAIISSWNMQRKRRRTVNKHEYFSKNFDYDLKKIAKDKRASEGDNSVATLQDANAE